MNAIISASDLEVRFGGRFSASAVRAVDGINLELGRGEVLGIIGESGSGKSTLGRALIGLEAVTGGRVEVDGIDLSTLSASALRRMRLRMQMVFQDPHASLNPTMTVGAAIAHPLQIHGVGTDAADRRERVLAVLERVGLSPAEDFYDRLPAGLSGGQKQRVVIARAIVLEPDIVVADEPIAALDMSVRAKILSLMADLRTELGLSFVYITHDLASARFFCDRVAIMYLGRIVEVGPVEEIFANPRHPYTRALLAAVPSLHGTNDAHEPLRGEVPDAARRPRGCAFHPRCPVAQPQCGWEARDVGSALERRWAHASDEVFEQESSVLGGALSTRKQKAGELHLASPSGVTSVDVESVFARVRSQTPDEPLWGGVRSLTTSETGVRVQFSDAVDPRLTPVPTAHGIVEVACVLYGEPSSSESTAS